METVSNDPLDPVEELFLAFLHGRGGDAVRTLAELCAAHPEHEGRLQAMAAAYAASDPHVVASGAARSALTGYELLIDRLAARGPDGTRYQVGRKIGEGGGGEVWEVRDEDLDRHVALKVAGHRDLESSARFFAEAQVTARLEHPGIVPVHELGLRRDGRPYFVMRQIDGETLAEILAKRSAKADDWPLERLIAVLHKVGETIAYAHGKGVIHRDLKPANVMVGTFGQVYVLDWGLVRTAGVSAGGANREDDALPGITQSGTVLGTPLYMSPEQAAGALESVGPASDVYSLGAMLYETLAGVAPLATRSPAQTPQQLIEEIKTAEPAPLPASVPRDLAAICARAMARVPGRRYPTMSAFAEDLRAWLEKRPVSARPVGWLTRAGKWARRNRTLAIAGAIVLVVTIVSSVVLLFYRERAEVYESVARESQVARTRLELDRLMREEARLWPATPELTSALEHWVARANALLDGESALKAADAAKLPGLGELQARLADLRTKALPIADAELQREAQAHPLYAELQSRRAMREYVRRMLTGARWIDVIRAESDLAREPLPTDGAALMALAYPLVSPKDAPWDMVERGLALALRAHAAASPALRAETALVLAQAWLKGGDRDESAAKLAEAVGLATADNRRDIEGGAARVRAQLDYWGAAEGSKRAADLRMIEQHVAVLEGEVFRRRNYQFDEPLLQVRHDALATLVADLEGLRHPRRGHLVDTVLEDVGPSVVARLRTSREVSRRTLSAPDAVAGWETAIAAIAASPLYGGLVIKPQRGLLPLGTDVSGLWVFWNTETGSAPVRDAQGGWMQTDHSGLLFVLVPGGKFVYGRRSVPDVRLGSDPATNAPGSGAREVTIEPFFLSMFEMTQTQWWYLTGARPSYYKAGHYYDRWNVKREPWDGAWPVERVSWQDCSAALARIGLTLPSDAEWEYAYRAGTDTAYPTGDSPDSLVGFGNLADQYAALYGRTVACESWDDGNVVSARVGSYRPNAWGFHDMAGNLTEWVLDVTASVGNKAQAGIWSSDRQARGANFDSRAQLARSAEVQLVAGDQRAQQLGVRPARRLER